MRKAQADGKMPSQKSGSQIVMVLLWFVLWFWSRDFFDADFPEGKEQVHIASGNLHAIFTPDGALVAL